MSLLTLGAVLDRLRARARSDPGLIDTLRHLADADELGDPFATPPDDLRQLAREVNRQRQTDRLAQLASRSLTTPQVVELLASISDRKGVDRRRARGTLLGIRVGNQTLHPEWQFDRRRRDTRRGLDQVLAALREVAADPIEVDAIATAPRAEADGASVADRLADGDIESAVALALLAGDQS